MAEILLEKGGGSIPEPTPADEQMVLDYHAANVKGGHTCFGETALVMGFIPETVHIERLGIETGQSNHKADYLKEAASRSSDSRAF